MIARRIFCCLPTLLVLGLAGCAAPRNTKLDYRLPPFATPKIDLTCYRSVQERPGQSEDLALAVAISGGGHRAANFAMGVLQALEQVELDGQPHNLLREIDYLSTVSGGGFAAGVYIGTLYDHLQAKGVDAHASYSLASALTENKGRHLKNLERSYHDSLLEGFLHLRCLGFRDTGDLLERKFDRYILGSRYRKGGRSLTLGDMFKRSDSAERVQLPYWVTNATIYENGVRFPFVPTVLTQFGVDRYVHNMSYGRLDGDAYTLPLAVGVKTSASFPVAIPATTFVCRKSDDELNRYLHLLDGGLADNLGLRTAFELLKQDSATRKVLLVIDAYKGASHGRSSGMVSPGGLPVAYRIMRISLYHDHTMLGENIARLKRLAETPIDVVVLSFEELKPVVEAQIETLSEELKRLRKEETEAVMRRLRRALTVALELKQKELKDATKTYNLYRDARAVGTALDITEGEQQLLLRAGAAVVEQKRDMLRKLFSK